MIHNIINALILMGATLVLSACGPSEKQKAEWTEKKRIECLDKTCEGDVWPNHNPSKEAVFKVNGHWFIGPKEYGIYNGTLGFFWPSKTPANKENAEKNAPEFTPSGARRISNFYAVGIEIFLRSDNIPPEPRGYKLIQLAQEKGWIADLKILRPGLEAITMKHVLGPRQQYLDHVTYYVATNLKGSDGLPPVATCDQHTALGGGGAGFMWRPGIWAGTRMHQKHCADWPEIYQEITHVLKKIREAQS